MTFEERAKKVKVFIFDIQGIFTSPKILLINQKVVPSFYENDLQALNLLKSLEFPFGFISKGKNEDIIKFLSSYKPNFFYSNQKDKLEAYQNILEKYHYQPEEVFYMGDHYPDLPILKQVGLGVSVPNAIHEAQEIAHKVTLKEGGSGAVAEIIQETLKIKNIFLC